jgi:hypothetical protein
MACGVVRRRSGPHGREAAVPALRSGTGVPHRVRHTMPFCRPRRRAVQARYECQDLGKITAPGAMGAAQGTRASANTSGPDLTWAWEPVKLRTPGDPHRTKKTCFFCRTGFRKSELFKNAIQPFDLMSRRHPLFVDQSFSDLGSASRKQTVLKALVTCRHQAAGILSEARFTSSSWRPCGSSSQSSSLRSSLSLPS